MNAGGMPVISVQALCTAGDQLNADLNTIMIQHTQFVTILITIYTVVHQHCHQHSQILPMSIIFAIVLFENKRCTCMKSEVPPCTPSTLPLSKRLLCFHIYFTSYDMAIKILLKSIKIWFDKVTEKYRVRLESQINSSLSWEQRRLYLTRM